MHGSLRTALRNHLASLRMLLVFTVITGIVYPLAVTGVAQAVFSDQANGSKVTHNDKTVGSSLIGQSFDLPKKNPGDSEEVADPDPKWFQPRPGGYDPLATGASNLGPNDAGLLKTIKERRAAVAEFDGVAPEDVPVDALTASGSGIDPHISPDYAYQQVDRVARTRGLDAATVRKLVDDQMQGRTLGFLGHERVNIVGLNLALADLK